MSAPFYPPQLLLLPIQLQHRLPPPLQSVELEPLLLLHTFLSLPISTYTVKPSYAFPLALFGLVALHLQSGLLAHFQVLWLVSVALDVVWLLYKGSTASSTVVFLVGMNMLLKLVSAGAVARVLESGGEVRLEGGGAWGASSASGPGWMGASGLPGVWNGASGGARYQTIYDDGQDAAVGGYATEADAPPIVSPVSAPRPSSSAPQRSGAQQQPGQGQGQAAQATSGDKGGSYQTIA
ncbi:hypothetical protein FA10DRAFT_265895 [Acaromyces ingoldii]|uniref:Uncharacterized protein n=1 Tax=Acaromyces ingoldii TaxID=215250 RepID=A0A316YTJ0_9BASI|nr:hypothetical protein FA10DRAFT_265895 [Acaromyces ingoldii]PWN92094.1 hypothetical protein FA10DRAFT_265895 [Acaromyces ingoldii]